MPVEQAKVASLPKERKKTDKSLSAERAKTDESLSTKKADTEDLADDAVLAARAMVDDARSKARSEIDTTVTHDTKSEAALAEELLQKERKASDEALEAERQLIDEVLDRERNQKQVVDDTFLETERKETDFYLNRERKQTDREVQHATEGLAVEVSAHAATQAALTTRDEFLAIVSHDLKNPLGAISMSAAMLRDTPAYETADEETRQYVEVIDRCANEALRLIGDLLDMERISAGKLDLDIKTQDLVAIVRDTTEMFRLQAESKGVALETQQGLDKVLARCDRNRFGQALSNLIGNAIKFTPRGGKVTVSTHAAVDEVQVSVADTGPGIPAERHHTIFERFWQIANSDRHGLGLGLYIAKMLIEAQQGRIWLESHVGCGSTFYVGLPRE